MAWRLMILAYFLGQAGSELPPAAVPVERVSTLVSQLGSSSRREREQAEQTLIQLGAPVLGDLPESSTDPAVGAALKRVRRILESQAAQQAVAPSRISLSETLPPGEILKQVLRQTGNQVQLAAEVSEKPLAVAWNGTPFWEAIGQLSNQGKLAIEADRETRSLELRPAVPGAPAASSGWSGPVRVELLGQTVRPNLVDTSRSLVQVRWRVRVEPRLRPLYITVTDGECQLGVGTRACEALSPDAKREFPVDRIEGVELNTAFQTPKDATFESGEFSARGRIKVAALPLAMEFQQLDRFLPPPQRRGMVMGSLRDVNWKAAEKSLSLVLVITYDKGGPEFDSHRMWIHQNSAWLMTPEREGRLNPEEVELRETGPQGAVLAYRFHDVPGKLETIQFVYEAPALVTDVPFEVGGLRMQSP